MPKNVGVLGKLIVAKGFKNCPKSNKSPNLVTLSVTQLIERTSSQTPVISSSNPVLSNFSNNIIGILLTVEVKKTKIHKRDREWPIQHYSQIKLGPSLKAQLQSKMHLIQLV